MITETMPMIRADLEEPTVLCRTCLPYRDPGDGVRLWSRRNGYVKLELQAARDQTHHALGLLVDEAKEASAAGASAGAAQALENAGDARRRSGGPAGANYMILDGYQ